MFRIGEFARLTRVSVKMLRHYDEIGLFQPARVDVDSGYRFYASDQLPRLNRIIALKDLGFGLERIRTLLDGDLTIDQIRGMLKAQRAEAQAVIESGAQRMRAIEARLDRIEREETLPTHDVVLRAVRPILVACIRQRTDPHGVSALFEELEAYCARHAARAVAPPLSIDYSDDPGEAEHDIEVLVPIRTPIPSSNRVDIRTLEGHASMACVVYGGSYAGDQAARESLLTWIEFNGYRMDGPSREVYLRFGADLEGYELPDAYLAASAGEFVTEIQIPVRR